MWLDDVATYLDAQSSAFVVGTNLTKGFMPETSGDVVTIYAQAGYPPEYVLSTGGVSRVWDVHGLQVLSRSTSLSSAMTNAETVYELLADVVDTRLPTSTGSRYVKFDAQQYPFQAGRDSNDRYLVSHNYLVWREA